MKTVGAYEAKTHLPRLLGEVAKGETVTITKHGVPVAILIAAPEARRKSVQDAIAALRTFRRGKTLGRLRLRQVIEEGRRF